ncbi:type II toxin-antitoxin system ParD family antitoxin [Henriciella barbarensis]|uniref:Type II toxin-antitoxin system ParD family antitoxin n=1 Tax=Henriciella barbarensis TaxID=86342 RepID=A0A399R5H4_9PROT|nr:type II toxin-antitoxin system ParD family antitoxin [Henriciella barbarensis]RIJ25831.1 type II toxin-antitoxin system ParD family antitoxin [Henriciella barbarensis]
MATMNISLPQQMKDWVEEQTKDGKYANSSDVVRDLIRRELTKREKIAAMQEKIDEAYASGFVEVDDIDSFMDDIMTRAGL